MLEALTIDDWLTIDSVRHRADPAELIPPEEFNL